MPKSLVGDYSGRFDDTIRRKTVRFCGSDRFVHRIQSRYLFQLLLLCLLALPSPAEPPQAASNAGSIDGSVTDPSGAAIPGATVTIQTSISGFKKSTNTDETGSFHFSNIPFNTYHLTAESQGFQQFQQDVPVRSSVPVTVTPKLAIAGAETSVTVEASGSDLIENVPYAHSDVDRTSLAELPLNTPGAGLSTAIEMNTPGVVADSNGQFHPLGDHGQVSMVIDGQPISDQQNKQFSTQIPVNAIQGMELITGAPSAEYGDKTSLVVNATTRSGLGQTKPTGTLDFGYGTFGTATEEATIGFGTAKFGNFLAVNTLRSGRFLDSPEFYPMHDIGNNQTYFDRIDYQASSRDGFHLNLFHARNWFQIPNTYDQPLQDQRQKVLSYDISPGWQHTFSPTTLFTINSFFRQDQVHYYPSGDIFADTPASVSQSRRLTNYGVKADISYVSGVNNIKAGTQIMRTDLTETFSLGVTDPTFNPPCLTASGDVVTAPGIFDPKLCSANGYVPNTEFQSGLAPYDLTRDGQPFLFHGTAAVKEYAVYVQDSITLKNLVITPGFRFDHYDGISQANGVEPRVGLSYNLKSTGTVIRAAFSRTFETPYNENLIVSSATGQGGLAQNIFGATEATPLRPGNRNQYNFGLQQSFSKYLLLDGDYFLKFTRNAFDYSTLLNTPIAFPIEWNKSKIDGVSIRLSTPMIHDFQFTTTFGHTRARFFPPGVGGLIFDSPLNNQVFRIDHDENFEQATNIRYQRPHNGFWATFTWRYDSGQVAGAVTDLGDILALSAAQQAAIGFSCGSNIASLASHITSCPGGTFNTTRLKIPAPGAWNPDTNPTRMTPRNLFDAAIGTDNILRSKEGPRLTAKLEIVNLTNEVALYNFLSTFSGTHFVPPRMFQAQIGWVF